MYFSRRPSKGSKESARIRLQWRSEIPREAVNPQFVPAETRIFFLFRFAGDSSCNCACAVQYRPVYGHTNVYTFIRYYLCHTHYTSYVHARCSHARSRPFRQLSLIVAGRRTKDKSRNRRHR